MKSKRLIEYIPPQRSELLQFATQICKQMGIPDDDRDTIRGLYQFLDVASRIKAKKMSSEDVKHE